MKVCCSLLWASLLSSAQRRLKPAALAMAALAMVALASLSLSLSLSLSRSLAQCPWKLVSSQHQRCCVRGQMDADDSSDLDQVWRRPTGAGHCVCVCV